MAARHLRRIRRRFAASVILVVVTCLSGACTLEAAQQGAYGWSAPVDSLRVAQYVIETFFPELSEHNNVIQAMTGGSFDTPLSSERFLRGFGIQVEASYSDILKYATAEMIGKGLLYASSVFNADGSVEFMFIQGRANRYLEHQGLRNEIEGHPDWSDLEVIRVLHQRGMRFGPDTKDAFTKALSPALEKLAGAMGGTLKNINAVFKVRIDSPNGPTYRAAQLEWHVDFEIVPVIRGRATQKYALTFEAAGGKLQHIIKID